VNYYQNLERLAAENTHTINDCGTSIMIQGGSVSAQGSEKSFSVKRRSLVTDTAPAVYIGNQLV